MVWCNCAYQPVNWVRAYRHTCGSEASVTDIPADSAPTTTDVLASQMQRIQTYLLVRCNSNRHAYCKSAIVTDMPGGRVLLYTYACCLRANFKDMGTATGLLVS